MPPSRVVPWNFQSAISNAVSPSCTTVRVVSWIVGFIATYSARALRIALMPRAGPLRAIRNPSTAYKSTIPSMSPEFSACSNSLWRSAADAIEFTPLRLLCTVICRFASNSLLRKQLRDELNENRLPYWLCRALCGCGVDDNIRPFLRPARGPADHLRDQILKTRRGHPMVRFVHQRIGVQSRVCHDSVDKFVHHGGDAVDASKSRKERAFLLTP